MSQNLFAGLACAIAIAAPLAAQEPQQTAPKPSTSSQPSAATAAVTIEGCLMRELDVPGRRAPDAAQSRTNTDDDFVLIDAKAAQDSKATTAPTASPQPDTPVGTSGTVTSSPAMFKVKDIDSAKLVEHKNQRVRIQGTIDRTDRTNNPDTFAGDLVLLRGTAIEKIEGACPSKSNEKQ